MTARCSLQRVLVSSPRPALYITPKYYNSFHFLLRYPYITPTYYSSFHFLFHYPYITPTYYRSFHFPFHYPYITPTYYSSFHFLFHYPYITPKYYNSFHFLFHYPYVIRGLNCGSKGCQSEHTVIKDFQSKMRGKRAVLWIHIKDRR